MPRVDGVLLFKLISKGVLFIGNESFLPRCGKKNVENGQNKDLSHWRGEEYSEAVGKYREEKEKSVWRMGRVL